MAEQINEEDAKEIGDNHEEAGARKNQPQKEIEMDLHNNQVGRDCGIHDDDRSCSEKCLRNWRLQTGL